MTTISIPLSKLRLSPLNARQRVDGTVAADTGDLEASIRTLGLLSPLIIHAMPKPRGHYGVLAGGRRLRAMQALVERGVFEKDHSVDCVVRDEDAATSTELSVIENTARVALTPAQEFQAFAKLRADGAEEARIAERFGVTVLHVRQRMRLGELHPAILEALDAGAITLDVATGFASVGDRALQKRVFDDTTARDLRCTTSAHIRQKVRRARSAYDLDAMLRYVGERAYRDAGGQLEEDLFAPGTFEVLHPGTLSDLHYAKLETDTAALKAKLPEGVEITTSASGLTGYAGDVDRFRSPTEEQHARLQAIDARTDSIGAELAEWSDDAEKPVAVDPAMQSRVDDLAAEAAMLEAESERLHTAAPLDIVGEAIVVAVPTEDGLQLRSVYRPAGWQPDTPAGRAAAGSAAAPAEPITEPSGLDPRLGSYDNPAAAAKDEHGLTADALEVMRSHRRAILRGMMVSQTTDTGRRIAGDYLAFATLRLTLQRAGDRNQVHAAHLGVAAGTGSTAAPRVVDGLREEIGAQPCQQMWAGTVDGFTRADWMTEKDLGRAFAMFTGQPDEDRDLAMAVAAGIVLDRSLRAPGYAVPPHDSLAFLLGMEADEEVRRLWRPDAAFFDRLPKARRVAAVEEVNPAAARQIGRLKADEQSKACERFFRADRAAVREFNMRVGDVPHAQRWLPEFLRFDDTSRGRRLIDNVADVAAEREVAA